MSSIFSKFTKCYKPTSKTLRFTLIPQGKTQELITKSGILSQDLTRVNYYNEVKSALDEVHKKFIEESLLDVSLNWQELYDAHEEYRLTKNDENLKNTRLKYIKNLVAHFKDKQKNFELEPAKIISKLLNGTICIDNCNLDAIKQFDRFATYFEGYKENRNNVYGEQQNSVAYRVVVENFSKFYSNLKKYYALPDEIKATLNNSIKLIFDNVDLNTVFSIENFNDYIAQSGIDKYNTIIGGISKDVNNKIQGLNEICNLEYQQGRLNKKVVFDVLYKQILSDRQTLSFIEESYQNDKDLLTDLDSHLFELNKFLEDSFANVINLLTNNNCNFSYIYVDKKQMPILSKMIYDNWFILEEKFAKKSKLYSVESIIKVSENYAVLQLINNRLKEARNQFSTAYANVKNVLCKNVICSYDEIKECLDTIINLEKLLKLLIVNTDDEKDDEFYSIYEPFYNKVRESVSVYNRVRNYATKKEYLDEKVKINFDSPTLCNGWDQNKEKDYNCIILLKNNNYYLGVYNKNNRAFVEETEEATDDNCYKKMIYKLLPDPKKTLPHVFFSKKGLEQFSKCKEVYEDYKAGKHKKGSSFNLSFCHKLINVFKECIAEHPDWSKFNFKFSPTESYKDTSQFYNEISKQAYEIKFSFVTNENIEKLINEGKLFLFKIYNKDFSVKSTGNKNLHTLYWQQIFEEENIKKPVFQLCGGAELFYRRASISNPFIHEKDSILVKKTSKDFPIDNELLNSAIEDAKIMSLEDIKLKYPSLEFRLAPHKIIKNKRFTEDQYKFHCPIALNYDAKDEEGQKVFNQRVAKAIRNNEDVNVIGIDRGERNLLYVSVIDNKGNILEQKSLNVINGVNYHDKLVAIASKRDEQRKNWKAIESIKDLKKGYLSLVVNEICQLMIKYNAVIIMENLNYGFKNSRVHVEQQAYQNFEIALLQKLNYLSFKNVPAMQEGGISNAYQLTAKYKSFDMIGTQSGFVFYVPSNYTSKIDPATGFVNLFSSKHVKYENITKSQEFFDKFTSISYNNSLGYIFTFKYSNFSIEDAVDTEWQVCTGKSLRCVYTLNRNSGRGNYENINVTSLINDLFSKYNISNNNLKYSIIQQTSKQFFEKLLWLFKVTVSLRYTNSKEDYILSPIAKNGEFFDSRIAKNNYPCDGDANGAYHIALKGLKLITEQIDLDGNVTVDKKGETNKNWFTYAKKIANGKE